jgi:NADP-dependent 3-hydroxy acid dehydrogenase YdfG
MTGLKDKVALITDSTSGIGLGTARAPLMLVQM